VSKRIRERDVAFDLIDPEFERALEEGTYRQKNRDRQTEHKTRQLCRQVQRALNLALAGHFTGGELDDLFISDVSAVPGCGRLIVHVAIPSGRSVHAALSELRERGPQLRAIVAASISRKRAPELSFVPTVQGGDEYE